MGRGRVGLGPHAVNPNVPARGGHVDAPGRRRHLEEARSIIICEEHLLRHAAAAVRVGRAEVAFNTTGPRGHVDVDITGCGLEDGVVLGDEAALLDAREEDLRWRRVRPRGQPHEAGLLFSFYGAAMQSTRPGGYPSNQGLVAVVASR